MGIEKAMDELEKAAMQIVDFYNKYCNIHQQIIVDSLGVRIVSEELFIPNSIQMKDKGKDKDITNE